MKPSEAMRAVTVTIGSGWVCKKQVEADLIETTVNLNARICFPELDFPLICKLWDLHWKEFDYENEPARGQSLRIILNKYMDAKYVLRP